MKGVNPKQLAAAEVLALCWNGGQHISDLIPCITTDLILKASQASFAERDNDGYRSLDSVSKVIGYYSRRVDRLNMADEPGKEQNQLRTKVRKLTRLMQKDMELYTKRAAILSTPENRSRNKLPILNKLLELACTDTVDRIITYVRSEHPENLDLVYKHYRELCSWVRSIIRYPGNPKAFMTLERYLAEKIISAQHQALCSSLSLSSYVLALMGNGFDGKLLYARYLVNNGKSSTLPVDKYPLIPQCANYLGNTEAIESLTLQALRQLKVQGLRDTQAFYGLEISEQSSCLFIMVENGLVTLFGVDYNRKQEYIDYIKKISFRMKDTSPLQSDTDALREFNFIMGANLLKDLDLEIEPVWLEL
ncbi:MAG: hypothetical protein JXR18_12380 [Neptuniibacter sp.]